MKKKGESVLKTSGTKTELKSSLKNGLDSETIVSSADRLVSYDNKKRMKKLQKTQNNER